MKCWKVSMSFTLLILLILSGCGGNSKPDQPGSPAGPSSGLVNETLSFSAHTIDPDDDDIAYQFDWGDGNLSSWSSYVSSGQSVSINHSYSSEDTYEVIVKAKDINGKESNWSVGHQVEIVKPDTSDTTSNSPPNTPSTPSGPNDGYIDSVYKFTTFTNDPDTNDIAYKYDWGDGDTTAWSSYYSSGDTISLNHSYGSEGIFDIRAKARDNNGNESEWSNAHNINISGVPNSPPDVPTNPSGPDSGFIDKSYDFIGLTTDQDGDSISYQFSWGNGDLSNWSDYVVSGSPVTMSYQYANGGSYDIQVRAKDTYEDQSSWSNPHTVYISDDHPPETPTVKLPFSILNSTVVCSTFTSDPDGDDIAYKIDWGTDVSPWSNFIPDDSIYVASHQYNNHDSYEIKVKAKDSEGAESEWTQGDIVYVAAGSNSTPTAHPDSLDVYIDEFGTEYECYTCHGYDPDGDPVKIHMRYEYALGEWVTASSGWLEDGYWSHCDVYVIEYSSTVLFHLIYVEDVFHSESTEEEGWIWFHVE